MARRGGAWEGPILLAWAALAIAALAATAAGRHGAGEAAVRAVIRATAASSLGLFLLAFAAAPLQRLVRRPTTAWALRNRRWIGLSVALSHGLHLAAIAVLVRRWPAASAAIDPATRAAGSLGAAALVLLVVTSHDRAVARLGPTRWRALHRGACWVLWVVFLLSYAPGAPGDPWHAAATGLLLGVAALRGWSRRPASIAWPLWGERSR